MRVPSLAKAPVIPPNCVSCVTEIGCSSRRTKSCAEQPPTCRRPTCREKLYQLVKELAAEGIPVAVTCPVCKLARQPYYRWLCRLGWPPKHSIARSHGAVRSPPASFNEHLHSLHQAGVATTD